MPLKADYLKFVDKFVHEQDTGKAALSSGFSAKYGKTLYAMPEVRAEIDARLAVLNLEKAKLTAQTHILGKQLIDEELTKAIKGDFGDIQGHMGHKLEAIEMGYRRIGMISGGEFIPDPDHHKPVVEQTPRIFRAQHAEILSHTIETKETVQRVTTHAIETQEAPPDACYDY